MNFIDKGIAWFEKRRVASTVEPVTIRTSASEIQVLASIVEPESEVTATGLKVRADMYVFLVNAATIASLSIARGDRIFRRGEMYEVISERNSITDYNDSNNTTVAIQAQRRPYAIN